MKLHRLPILIFALTSVLASCAGTDVNRSLCEGFRSGARVVDPLADPKTARDPVTCEAYEAERARLQKTKQD
jgi:hypothetical protein